jgi:hypothetical protein
MRFAESSNRFSDDCRPGIALPQTCHRPGRLTRSPPPERTLDGGAVDAAAQLEQLGSRNFPKNPCYRLRLVRSENVVVADCLIWSCRHEFDVFEDVFEIGRRDRTPRSRSKRRRSSAGLRSRVGSTRPLRLGRPSCTHRDDRRRREHSDLVVFEPRSLRIRLPGSSGGAIEPVWWSEHAIRKSKVPRSIVVSSLSICLHQTTRG